MWLMAVRILTLIVNIDKNTLLISIRHQSLHKPKPIFDELKASAFKVRMISVQAEDWRVFQNVPTSKIRERFYTI